jgi:hypothetical protein
MYILGLGSLLLARLASFRQLDPAPVPIVARSLRSPHVQQDARELRHAGHALERSGTLSHKDGPVRPPSAWNQ